MTPKQKQDWAERRTGIRRTIAPILYKLRKDGEVDEIDLDRLQNYCMTMLMVLSKITPGTLDNAMRDAELAGFLHDQVEDV